MASKISILTVLGNRPHFIKSAAVSNALGSSEAFIETTVHTGQHYDTNLSEDFIKELNLPTPSFHLNVGTDTVLRQISRIIMGLDEVIKKVKPLGVIVYGDTNSTLAGAIAASKTGTPLFHIEAGLREFNRSVPEEINKLMVDAVTDLFFCPTQTSVRNLQAEGHVSGVHLVGDVGLDLLLSNKNRIYQNWNVISSLLNISKGDYYLCTCHRQANTDKRENLESILRALTMLQKPVVLPLHPRTRAAISDHALDEYRQADNLIITESFGFWDTQALIKHAKACITDSGGVIKESYFHKVPGVIIDTQTEWIETVDEGWNQVVGPKTEAIIKAAHQISTPKIHTNAMGDGSAAEKIVQIMENFFRS